MQKRLDGHAAGTRRVRVVTGGVLLVLLAVLLVACTTVPLTGRSQLMLISEETAIAASEPAYFQLLSEPAAEGRLDNDAALRARVEHITGRIIAQAIRLRPETADWKWSIHVIDEPETINAWAMAGGRMAIYSGLIHKLEPTDDELAQALGHEVAHALARHSAEQMSVALATNVAINVWAVRDHPSTGSLAGVSLAAALAIQLPNSRGAESEADRIGIELAARAGYDPAAAVTLWQKMSTAAKSGVPAFLSTHPSHNTRIEELRALVPTMRPLYEAASAPPVYEFPPAASGLPGVAGATVATRKSDYR